MKKIVVILILSVVCIGLGLSVKWFREQGTTLVVASDNAYNTVL